VPFEEIAPIVGRSPAAARQVASRARRRVQGEAPASDVDLAMRWELVDASWPPRARATSMRWSQCSTPTSCLRADAGAPPAGMSREVRGAKAVARDALAFSRLDLYGVGLATEQE
jgi:hypothetical protein